MEDCSVLPQLRLVGFCEKGGLVGTRRVEKHVRILDSHGLRRLGERPATHVAGCEIKLSETSVEYPKHWTSASVERCRTRAGAGRALRACPLETTVATFNLPLCFFDALFVIEILRSPKLLFEVVSDIDDDSEYVDSEYVEEEYVEEVRGGAGPRYNQVLQLGRPKPGEMYTKEFTDNICSFASLKALDHAMEICITRENEEIILTLSSGSRFSAVAPRGGDGTLALFFDEPEEQRLTFTSEHCEGVYTRETSVGRS
jgi:hypothetical protein